MSSKPKMPANPDAAPSHTKKHILASLLVLAIAAIGVLYIQHQQNNQRKAQALAADKAAFAQIETDMAKTHTAILAALPKPASDEQYKNCGIISHKYDNSDIRCQVGFEIHYDMNAIPKAKAHADSFEEVMKDQKWLSHSDGSKLSDFQGSDPFIEERMQDYQSKHGIACRLSLKLNNKQSPDKSVPFSSWYTFHCSKPVKTPVYKLVE